MARDEETIVFRLLVPEALAALLMEDPSLRAVSRTAPAGESDASKLNLDLTTAAAVITLVVGAAQLADYALRIARAAMKYREEARVRRAERMMVQGAERDRVVTLGAADVDSVAETIEQTVGTY